MKLKTISEGFDTTFDLLLDPKNNDKTFNELLKEFEKDGGEILGTGRYGMVLGHPKWKFVLKVYDDQLYTQFVRLANKIYHPSFPKFCGVPKKILPNYGRTNTFEYIIRMEKLNPIDDEVFKHINKYIEPALNYFHNIDGKSDEEIEQTKEYYINLSDFYASMIHELNDKNLYNLCHGMHIVVKNIKGTIDLHSGNIMTRDNGEYVVVDPLFPGYSMYEKYDYAMKMETDGFVDYEPDIIPGGKRYSPYTWKYKIKPKRRKKKKKPTKSMWDGLF